MRKYINWMAIAGLFACFTATTTVVEAQTRAEVIDASQDAVNFIIADSKRPELGSCFSCHNTGQAIRAGAMAELSPDLSVDQTQLNKLVGYINNQQFTDVAGTTYSYWTGYWWWGYWTTGTQNGRYDGAITHESRNPYLDPGSSHPNTTTSWAMFSEIELAGNQTSTPFDLTRFLRGAAYLERTVNANGFLPADHIDGPVDANNPGETARAVMVLVKAQELDGQAHWTTAINTGVNYLRGLNPRSENFYYVQDAGWIVQALSAAGVPASDPKISSLIALIKGRQAADGGWSMGTTASVISTSDAFGTGVALMSLLAVGETNSSRFPDFRDGINWLLDNQTLDGGWASAQGRSRVSSSTWAVLSLTALATTPPTIIVPDDLTVEATGPDGAIVSYTVSAVSDNGTPVPVTLSIASGSTFALGATTVTASATIDGESATNSFTVTVVDTTKPALTVPASQTLEATGPGGAIATFSASATDLVSGPRVVNFSQESGTMFPLTTTLVNVSASDAAGNTATGLFGVTVRDTTPPTLALKAPVVVEATGPGGANVTFGLPTASDLVTTNPTMTASPASGSTFPLGTTPVTITASDARNNSTSTSFPVIVRDTTAPVIAAQASLVVEATSANGAVVSFPTPSAGDVVSGNVAVTALPASGSAFSIGTTTVKLSAVDGAGNTGTASFTVTVRDTIAPVLTVPANVVLEATSAAGAVATFTASATDAVGATVTTSVASGSTFAFGTTTVNVTAVDAAGNSSTGSFTVTVRDTTAPTFSVAPSPSSGTLWPPNHQMVPISVTASALDVVGATLRIVRVTSSEPDNGLGDGDTAGDWVITGPLTVNLRAERGGNGSGRTYTITVEARDAANNVTESITSVFVPKSLGKK